MPAEIMKILTIFGLCDSVLMRITDQFNLLTGESFILKQIGKMCINNKNLKCFLSLKMVMVVKWL